MDEQHDHSADPELELTDAIDNLLGEIETACADPSDPASIDITSETLITDTGTAAVEPNPESVESESPDDSADDQGSAPEPDAAQEALESIDAIGESTEDLLEATLDALLEDEQQSEPEQTPAMESITEQDDPEAAADQSEAEVIEPEPISTQEEVDDSSDEPAADAETEPEAAPDSTAVIDPDAHIESEQFDPEATDPEPAPTDDEMAAADLSTQDDDAMLEDAVGDLLTEIEDESEPEAKAEPETDPETAQEPAPPTPDATQEPGPETEPEPDLAASAVDSGVIDQLDDALAGAADDLLEGDFETPEGELVEATTVDYTVDPQLLLDEENPQEETPEQRATQEPESIAAQTQPVEDQAPASESTPEPESKPEPEQTTATQDAPVPATEPAAQPVAEPQTAQPSASAPVEKPATIAESAPASPSVPASEPALEESAESTTSEPSISVFAKVASAIEPLANRALTAAGPTGAKAVLAASKPLANRSPDVRNAVGWVALWTMFCAIVVWGWALFFNTSSAVAPTQAPTPIVSPEFEPGVTASHQP